MATYLWQLQNELSEGLSYLQTLRDEKYPNNLTFKDFVNVKKWDLEDFNRAVNSIPTSTFMPEVVDFLKRRGDRRFLGMAMRGKDYFKVTKKVLKAVEEEEKK